MQMVRPGSVRRVTGYLLACVLAGGLVGCAAAEAPAPASPTTAGSPARATLAQLTADDARITVTGDSALLTATIVNGTGTDLTLRAIACTCAGAVQLGTRGATDGQLTPLSKSPSVPAGGSLTIGTDVVVRLSGLHAGLVDGQQVGFVADFAQAGQTAQADLKATVLLAPRATTAPTTTAKTTRRPSATKR